LGKSQAFNEYAKEFLTMPTAKEKTAKKAWRTIKKKEKHADYVARGQRGTVWLKKRNLALRPLLLQWKEELAGHVTRCVVCGESMPNTFEAHHLDGDEKNNDPENRATLCASCHRIINKAVSDEEAQHDFEERHKRMRRI
jgi:5-methylcytosine-specific restriction endonuclease McrA